MVQAAGRTGVLIRLSPSKADHARRAATAGGRAQALSTRIGSEPQRVVVARCRRLASGRGGAQVGALDPAGVVA